MLSHRAFSGRGQAFTDDNIPPQYFAPTLRVQSLYDSLQIAFRFFHFPIPATALSYLTIILLV